MADTGSGHSVPSAPSADLALLVATEQELEESIAQAREQARAMIESAYTEAGARSSELERELAAARERFQAELEIERARRAAEVLAEGKRQAARFDAVPEARVTELAGVVVAGLLSGLEG